MTDQLKRGEVWLADLNPTQGSEQAGIRPVKVEIQAKINALLGGGRVTTA